MKPTSPPDKPPGPRSLANLDAVSLDPFSQRLFDFALATNGGPGPWRARKQAEVRDLIALSQVSRRFRIERIDLFDPLRVLLIMQVGVPCLPDPAGPLQIEKSAHIGLTYRQAALRTAQPGTSFVEILLPRHVWLPNVSNGSHGPQVLCLGPSVAAGIRTVQIMHQIFGAVSLQTVQMNALDPAGVLSREAADYWQQPANLTRLPLTREPFLCPDEVKP